MSNADSPCALPGHVAIIMDGNGRWAQARGLPRTAGHRKGADAVRTVVRSCRELGIRALTLYAFSAQNWQRPASETAALMALLVEFLSTERAELLTNGIRLRAIGQIARLPVLVRELLAALERETAHGTGMILTLALSYGGQEEIAAAARALVENAQAGRSLPELLDEEAFGRLLPSMGAGPVDLLIRTGGEQRISNFMLWAAAYAELHFSSVLWPDFEREHLLAAFSAFGTRERRFGALPLHEAS